MTHTHHHDHEHTHGHKPANFGRAFAVGILLNIGFVAVEGIYGFLAHSVALLADATHNLSDVLSLLLAWGASVLSRRPPSQDFTYGLRSSSILAALINAVLLLVVTGGIAWETMQRLMSPLPVAAETVIWIAALGVLINTATALLFMSGRKTDLNIRGAFLHMATDAAVSLGVVLAGVGILVGGWFWLDPAISLLIVIVILVSTWGFLWESIKLALHAVPESVNPLLVRNYLAGLPGVTEIHDFHIWGMSTTETAMTVHLVMPNGHPGDVFMAKIAEELHDRFHIQHATMQVELGDGGQPCVLAPDHIV
ncbi:cation diffusion facilitator family transporter [Methylomicrobium lacus]|uniref:cation diffusion facilitator family transporter n=1 Tax=Methylomicrobium lacus TaxID=136992 RepID=UPI00045EA508|nr:cation diffusion facilitator family transporter [Methylomicrobium lacus]